MLYLSEYSEFIEIINYYIGKELTDNITDFEMIDSNDYSCYFEDLKDSYRRINHLMNLKELMLHSEISYYKNNKE